MFYVRGTVYEQVRIQKYISRKKPLQSHVNSEERIQVHKIMIYLNQRS